MYYLNNLHKLSNKSFFSELFYNQNCYISSFFQADHNKTKTNLGYFIILRTKNYNYQSLYLDFILQPSTCAFHKFTLSNFSKN